MRSMLAAKKLTKYQTFYDRGNPTNFLLARKKKTKAYLHMHSTGSVIDCIQETVVLIVLVRKGENEHRVTYHLKFNF